MPDWLTPEDIEAFTGEDTDLTDGQVAAATQAVRLHCRWHIAPARTETIVADGVCGTEVFLPSLNVVDCTEIRVDGTADPTVDWWRNGRLRRTAGFTDTPRLIEADVVHGVEWELAPEVVAVVAAVAARIDAATGEDATIAEEAIGSYRIRYQGGTQTVNLTDSEMLMLSAHRFTLTP